MSIFKSPFASSQAAHVSNIFQPRVVNKNTYDFRVATSSIWTCVRAGTVATYVDEFGKWQQASANTIRIHHDSTGTALGIIKEVSRTNLANHNNMAPTILDGVAVISGDGAASVVANGSVVDATIDDSTFITLQNGNVIKCTAVATETKYQISLATGNTNNHSFRICVAPQGTGSHGDIRLSNDTSITAFTTVSGAWEEIVVENITVDTSARYLELTVLPGKEVHFIATQFEKYNVISTPIISTGAAGVTRATDQISADVFDTGLTEQIGGITIITKQKEQGVSEYGYFGVVNDASDTEKISIRQIPPLGYTQLHFKTGGSEQWTEQIHIPILNERNVSGVIWDGIDVLMYNGFGMRSKRITATTPSGLNTFYLGTVRLFWGYFEGIIEQLTIFHTTKPDLQDVLDTYIKSGQKAILCAGQSNMEGWSKQPTTFLNGGELKAKEVLDTYFTDDTNFVANHAWGGSRIFKSAGDDNHWLNDDSSRGYLLNQSLEAAKGFRKNIKAIIWNQGESNLGLDETILYNAWLTIAREYRKELGDIPFIIEQPSRRTNSEDTGYILWRKVNRDLANNNSFIHLAPESFIYAMQDETGVADSVHKSNQGFIDSAYNSTRKALAVAGEAITGVDGPSITSAVRSTTTITVTISHDAGTDFTPTTGIEGFKFFDDASEITINTAVRTDATTITLTLASTPVGLVETLYYGYSALYGVTPANLVRDNATNVLPLISTVIIL